MEEGGIYNMMMLLAIYYIECGEDRDSFAATLKDKYTVGDTAKHGNGEGGRNEKVAGLISAWAKQNTAKMDGIRACFQ